MINRSRIQCRACSGEVLFRIGLGIAPQQRFAFLCPICGSRLRGVLTVQPGQKPVVASDDYVDLEGQIDEGVLDKLPSTTVYVDLPIHKDAIGKSLAQGGSAFLELRRVMGASIESYIEKFDALRQTRQSLVPELLRAYPVFASRNWFSLSVVLKNGNLGHLLGSTSNAGPRESYLRLLQFSLNPLVVECDAQLRCHQEVLEVVATALTTAPEATSEFLRSADRQGIRAHLRTGLIEVSARLAEQLDMFIPALAIDHFSDDWRARIGEFRWFRDDFELLKQLYVDTFEVASTFLALLGPLSNIARRGSASVWLDQEKRKATALFADMTSERRFVLDEFPQLRQSYESLSAKRRNEFSHMRSTYDIATGAVRLANGKEVSIFTALNDLRAGAVLAPVLLGAVDYLDAHLQPQG